MKRTQRSQARSALDGKLSAVDVRAITPPTVGWVRAIRDALGMTTRQLARRMGVAPSTVASLEQSERAGLVQLDTLRRAADALDCDLVYALVPRIGLSESVRRRAYERAYHEIMRVDRTMRLEAHGVGNEQLLIRINDYAAQLVDSAPIWDDRDVRG